MKWEMMGRKRWREGGRGKKEGREEESRGQDSRVSSARLMDEGGINSPVSLGVEYPP